MANVLTLPTSATMMMTVVMTVMKQAALIPVAMAVSFVIYNSIQELFECFIRKFDTE